jgi:uncharacterized membrane protein YgcG
MNTEAIYAKVQAILDRANHPNTPQAEAETALAMAQRLMMKHGLEESAFAKAQDRDENIVTEVIEVGGKWQLRRLSLASVIAKANSVACYRSTRWRDGKSLLTLVVYGTAGDIFAVKTLFASADLLASRVIPKGDRSFRNAWWLGFSAGVSEVLRKSKNEVIAEQGVGTGLVLADKFKRADSEMRAKVKLKSAGYSRYSSGSGYSAGQSAGRAFSTGGIGNGVTGALGR